MSEMTEHVLSAIVDQIPDEHLANAHTLIERRLGWQSVYIIDANMWCFSEEILNHVEKTLEDLGRWTKDDEEYWHGKCMDEWIKRFRDSKADTYDYGECLSEVTINDLQDNIRDAFVTSEDVHDLMRDTIFKHYGVQQHGV